MMKHAFLYIIITLSLLTARASNPERISWDDLSGTATPYPSDLSPAETPDSLTPVMVNHVGRHGARFPASQSAIVAVAQMLVEAYDRESLTPAGMSLLSLMDSICSIASGRWGELDSLGIIEQREIAARMYISYPELLGRHVHVRAISSRLPRCMMSMYTFLHQLSVLDKDGMAVRSESGTALTDTLLRFFEISSPYRRLLSGETLTAPITAYWNETLPDTMVCTILSRLAGEPVSGSLEERLMLARAVYSVISGCRAMGIDADPSQWLTYEEYQRLWAAEDFSQYMRYSANDVSALPATMASPLLRDIIATTDRYLSGESDENVILRFGHAETLMPLLSLMRLRGAYYVAPENEGVTEHWRNYELAPMGANLRLTLFRSASGETYVRVDLNEQPIRLIAGDERIYLPWSDARAYLMACLEQ
ncbi:MAG: histidine phosphatase family protein [Pseudoflavonifractor sp.]|nr:histidine phosphatase family protein [Pseudoflavonifractor sp.]